MSTWGDSWGLSWGTSWDGSIPVPTMPTVFINQVSVIRIRVGGTRQLSATVEGTPTPTLAWASDNTDVATVHPTTGLVTGVGLGQCNITVTATNAAGADNDSVIERTIAARPHGITSITSVTSIISTG